MKHKLKKFDIAGTVNKLYGWSVKFDQMTADFLRGAGYSDKVIAYYLDVSEDLL